ncbi:MAG TPA: AEC family transporter [Anaerovoracaceae bacterium]|nr:AEC family transporter [Anaerovoracaceae bacterium]
MLTIISKISTIFIYILIGFIANRAKVITDEANNHIINLLLKITAPCLILSSIITKDLNDETYTQTIQVLILSISFFVVAAFIALFLVKPLKGTKDKGVLMVIITSINSAFIGYPITKAVFDNDIFYFVVIANIMLNIYLFLICIWQLNYGEKRSISIKSVLKPFLNVLSLATITAVTMLFLHIKLPDYPLNIIKTLGDITIPLSMLVVGVQLGGSNFKKIIKNKHLIWASFANVIIIPAITLLLMYYMPFSNSVKLVIVLSSTFPCAVVPVALAHREGKNATLLAEGVALTTLFSMITIPAWLIIIIKLFT